ncbi:Predicted arabinose efflux permease, MFS family [Rhizobiales bacterium GAS188]|nr:Predicted arabinose efflux permease, MFS family [Rhizobiales bacterium GAS188]
MQRQVEASARTGKSDAALTSWGLVVLLFLIGVTAAFQVGKVPGQLPAIARELDLSLFSIGLIISIFSLIAAVGGIFIGSLADRFGSLRLIVTGLALGGLASLAGSFAESGQALLASRVVEGFGFILATTSTPSLIVAVTSAAERSKALGVWSMYMPAGMSSMMVFGALLSALLGWRGIWQLTAALNLAYAPVIWLVFRTRATPKRAGAQPSPRFREVFAAALQPGPLLLAGCFTAYAGNFLALTGFLPLMLERSGEASAAFAGFLTAFVVAANMLGNAASGFIAERGLSRPQIIAIAAAIMGIAAVGVFLDELPFALRYGLALIFSAVGGVIPGTCFGAAQNFAESPAKAGAIFGGLIQGAGIGQLIGPPLAAAAVQAVGGWHGDALYIAAGATLNLVMALVLSRLIPAPSRSHR